MNTLVSAHCKYWEFVELFVKILSEHFFSPGTRLQSPRTSESALQGQVDSYQKALWTPSSSLPQRSPSHWTRAAPPCKSLPLPPKSCQGPAKKQRSVEVHELKVSEGVLLCDTCDIVGFLSQMLVSQEVQVITSFSHCKPVCAKIDENLIPTQKKPGTFHTQIPHLKQLLIGQLQSLVQILTWAAAQA